MGGRRLLRWRGRLGRGGGFVQRNGPGLELVGP